jgi:hypothetical protein
MRKLACLIVSLAYELSSSFAQAACADLNDASNWSNINTHKIIIYRGSKAIAILEIPYCDIYASSTIALDKEYICNGDKIIVSGVSCDIRNVTKP